MPRFDHCPYGRIARIVRLVIFSTAVFILPALTFAQDSKPAITVLNPIFDFGRIAEGEKVVHEFKVQNKGTADLQISRVVAGCGCTAATVLNQAIPANAETTVTVTLDTLGLSGAQNKIVRIYSNDTANPISTVSVNGTVDQRVSVEPANILFESITRGQKEGLSREVKISAQNKDVKIGAIESFSKYVKIESVKGDESNKSFVMTLDSELPLGDFRERIIVKLKGGAKSNLNIPVYANVKGSLQVVPPAVSFGIISGTELVTRKVTVENHGEKPYKLNDVSSSNKAVTTKVTEVKPGKIYSVDVILNPKEVLGDLRAELKFDAETETEESLAINVYGVLPPKI